MFQRIYNKVKLSSKKSKKRTLDDLAPIGEKNVIHQEKKLKSFIVKGIAEQDYAQTDVNSIKELLLNGHVKTLTKLEDVNDHEELYVEVINYKKSLKAILQAIYNISVEAEKVFVRCHECMKIVVESWNILHLNGSVSNAFEHVEYTLSIENTTGYHVFSIRKGEHIASQMWTRLLLAAACCKSVEKVTDEQLVDFIRDACEYGVNVIAPIKDENVDEDENVVQSEESKIYREAGLARLTALNNSNKSEFKGLTSRNSQDGKTSNKSGCELSEECLVMD